MFEEAHAEIAASERVCRCGTRVTSARLELLFAHPARWFACEGAVDRGCTMSQRAQRGRFEESPTLVNAVKRLKGAAAQG